MHVTEVKMVRSKNGTTIRRIVQDTIMKIFHASTGTEHSSPCVLGPGGMSAEEMAPPTGGSSSDSTSPVKAVKPTEESLKTKPSKTQETNAGDVTSEPSTTDFTASEGADSAKGRGRTRICKTCRFSCTDAREFSNHQRTAHAEGKEQEETAQQPATRRASLRHRRSLSGGPATTGNGAPETATENNGKTDSISLLISAANTVTGSISTGSDEPPAADETDSAELANAMIATSTPTANHQPNDYLNMSSSFSDDENDLSEEGGRLVIDDSNNAGGSVSVTPTRCGNIQNRTYVCSVCEFTSTAAKAYLRHQRDMHNYEIAIYECDICDYATKYKQKLPRHRKLHFSGSDFMLDVGQISDSTEDPRMITALITPTDVGHTPQTPSSTSEGVKGQTPTLPLSLTAVRDSLPPVIVDDGDDDDDGENSKGSGSPPPEISEIPDREPPEGKKKKTRQEVDPAKYFEVVDEVGMKFACSNCGNVYKWRKSLNKHWKEKHTGETPDSSKYPVGMMSLVQSGNHTPGQGGRRRIYHNQLLEKITVNKDESHGDILEDGASMGSPHSSRPETPQNFLNGSYNSGGSHSSGLHDGLDGSHMNNYLPSVIGPFITSSNQPVFPAKQFESLTASLNGPIPSQNALDLSQRSSPMDETDSIHHSASGMQNEPLDLAMKRDDHTSPLDVSIKTEQPWDESMDDVPAMDTSALDDEAAESDPSCLDSSAHKNNILKCKKCPFVAKTVVDYSAHMTLHLNKKAYKCAACQKHFEQLSLLNDHFASQHADLITSHKVCPHASLNDCDCGNVLSPKALKRKKSPSPDPEAIQRIPHGLQQTYHLLKMPLQSIPNLSSQDPAKTDEKQLKCNMCDFVAKWPAELQKHAVSHSEERPFMCMVCGSTYKWKWDMVKHFEKAHQSLSNPYKRREPGAPISSVFREGTPSSHNQDSNSGECDDLEPEAKRVRRHSNSSMPDLSDYSQSALPFSQDDSSVAGILAITRAANHMVSRQPNFLDDGPDDKREPVDLVHHEQDGLGIQIAHVRSLQQTAEDERRDDSSGEDSARPVNPKTQRAVANVVKNRQNGMPKLPVKPYSKVSNETAQLPYKCVQCEYRARWPSEITQHMKNHSNEKPFLCPLCTYKSKWKWDVVKHMRRCGTGANGAPLTIKDVIDTSNSKKQRQAPPNAMVMPEGGVEPINRQSSSHNQTLPLTGSSPSGVAFLVNTTNPDGKSTPTVVLPSVQPSSTPSNSASVAAALSSVSAALSLVQLRNQGLTATPSAAGPDSTLPTTSQQAQASTPKFRSLINGDKYVCLECPFVGNSPAELKRHQMLHSENKPFMCGVCGYSSRWKCDLKKHQKVYNHYSPDDQDDASDKDQSSFKCSTCGFEASSQQALAAHAKQHASTSNGTQASRFVCKMCSFAANDLSSLITHRKSEHPQGTVPASQSSPTPMDLAKTEEQDEARLKHPRKPMKKFTCSLCSFVCTKRSVLMAHMQEHEADKGGFSCFYCSDQYETKDKLLDHISTHPEFNPNEWETFFQEDEMDTEDVNNNSNVGKIGNAQPPVAAQTKPSMSDSGSLANTIDLTKAGVSPPPALIPVSQVTAASSSTAKKFECEWCSATFAHTVTLYQHARSVHPLQLRDQEAAEMSPATTVTVTSASQEPSTSTSHNVTFASIKAKPVNLNVSSSSRPSPTPPAGLQNSSPLLKAVASLQQRGNGQLSSIASTLAAKGGLSILPTSSLASELSEVKRARENAAAASVSSMTFTPSTEATKVAEAPMNLTMNQQPQQQFQCTKCPYVGSTANAYLRHVEQHSVQAPHGCLFCDFSTDRVNKVYLHMRSSHPQQWAMLGQQNEQHMLGLIARESLKHALQPNAEDTQDVISAVPNPVTVKDLHQQLPAAQPPLYRKKQVPAYQGTPLQPLMADGHRIYQCLLCQFISASMASVAEHTRDVHGPQGKYQCCYCNFSIDNLKLIQHHQETTHPNQRIAIDVLYLEELQATPQQDANKTPTPSLKAEPADVLEAPKLEKMLRCLQCPFKVPTAERLRQHMRCHNNDGKYQCRECDFSTDEPTLLLEHATVHEPGYTNSSASPATIVISNLWSNTVNLNKGEEDKPELNDSSSNAQNQGSEPTKNQNQTKALDLSVEVTTTDHALNEQAKNLTQKVRAAAGSGVGRIRYRCSECPYHTFCRNNIVKHRRQHLISNRYQCRYCSYSATRAFLLQQHERFHLQEKSNASVMSPGKTYHDLFLDPFDPTLENCMMGDEDMEVDHEEDLDMDSEVDEVMGAGYALGKRAAEKSADKEAKEIMEAEAANASGKSTPPGLDAAMLVEKQFRAYKCQHCPYSSNSNFEFRKHCRFHGTQHRYKCDHCSYSLDRLNLLTQHRKLHIDEPDYDANPLASQLLNHEAILKPLSASEAESLQVRVGDNDLDRSPSPAPSSPTAAVAKPETSAAEELLVCQSCPYKTLARGAFTIHSSMHGLKRKYICDFCDWSADRLSLLYQHRHVHANDPDFDPTPLDNIFLNHEFAEEVPGEFEAKILDLGASKDSSQPVASDSTHSSTASLSPPFKLSITKKMYTCHHCPFVTGNRNSFDYHQSLHGGPGCYSCDSCSYRTDRWSLLCQHTHLHEQHQMDEAKKANDPREQNAKESVKDPLDQPVAQNEADLKDKCKVASSGSVKCDDAGDSPDSELQCQRCPFNASSKHQLVQHVRQHAGPGTVVCPYCDFTASNEDVLLPHVQVHFTTPLDLDLDKLQQLLAHKKKEPVLNVATKDKLSASPTPSSGEGAPKRTDADSDAASASTTETVKKENKVPTSDSKSSSSVKDGEAAGEQNSCTGQKTKVYVCQYCEKEFDGKSQMIQHEREHLV